MTNKEFLEIKKADNIETRIVCINHHKESEEVEVVVEVSFGCFHPPSPKTVELQGLHSFWFDEGVLVDKVLRIEK